MQGILVSYIGKLRVNTTRWTDERVRLAGEAVAGCLAVKMLGGLPKTSVRMLSSIGTLLTAQHSALVRARACMIPVHHLHFSRSYTQQLALENV